MLSSRDVDPRTDIWSLGVVLYELLTAHAPFEGRNEMESCSAVLTQPPPALRPTYDLPEPLERVVLTCLSKDREARYPTMDALVKALTEVLALTA